ncbi:MAG TPA: isochorismatase family protein [Acidimicrobiales bacterium]|nr:isochorismatase family protein [Acidimicrobiales bacterium]
MPRVWEAFLTEQDKQAIALRPRRDRHVLERAERVCLLLIDNYRAVYGDRPLPILEAIEEWPGACGLVAWESIAPTQRLLAAARAAGVLVVYSAGATDVEGLAGQHVRAAEGPNDSAEVRYAIIPELAPAPGEWVVKKVTSSAFSQTPLLGHLIANRIDTLIVVGESTSGCVRASVVDAAQYQLNVVVAEECVFDRHEATHAINLFDLHQKFADVLPVAEVLDWISARTPAPATV